MFGSESRICSVFCFSVHNTWALPLCTVSWPKKTLFVPRDTTHARHSVCVSLRSGTWPRWLCPLGSATVFFNKNQGSAWVLTPEVTIIFHAHSLLCPSKYGLSLQYTHAEPSVLWVISHWNYLTNRVDDLQDERVFFFHLCVCVCVWCETVTDT